MTDDLPSQAPEGPRRSRLQFTGSGSEYFRLWIVNLLLTLLTLSLYHPFAKARQLRYFLGNTLVDGQALGFHGDPWKMLRGHLLVLLFFGCYAGAGQISPVAGGVAVLIFGALWPALWQASLRFRLANTSWRGLRFRFTGDVAGAYRAFWPLLLPAVVLGAITASGGSGSARAEMPLITSLLMVVSVVAMLLMGPLGAARIKRFQHGHYALADEATRMEAKTRSFYGLWLRSGLLSLLPIGIFGVAMALIVAALGRPAGSGGPKIHEAVAVLLPLAVMVVYLLMFLVIQTYFTSRLQNLVWNATASAHIGFDSRLRCRALAWRTTKNLLLMVCTLGLYRPFAAIHTARLRLEAVELLLQGDVAQWARSAAAAENDATGDAAADLLGVDIGL